MAGISLISEVEASRIDAPETRHSARCRAATPTGASGISVDLEQLSGVALTHRPGKRNAIIGKSDALAGLELARYFASSLDRAAAANFLLEQKDAVEQRFRCRRAAGNIDVHGDDAVAPTDDGIRIMIVSAAIGA